MFFKSKGGYPPQSKFSFYSFFKTVWVILKVAFSVSVFVVIYKLIGFMAIASILGICALIVLVFAIDESKSPLVQLGKMTFLTGFFIFTIIFIYKATGFAGIGTILGVAVVFSPMFLTKPAQKTNEPNMYLDPVYKGLSGNIFTDKNDE